MKKTAAALKIPNAIARAATVERRDSKLWGKLWLNAGCNFPLFFSDFKLCDDSLAIEFLA